MEYARPAIAPVDNMVAAISKRVAKWSRHEEKLQMPDNKATKSSLTPLAFLVGTVNSNATNSITIADTGGVSQRGLSPRLGTVPVFEPLGACRLRGQSRNSGTVPPGVATSGTYRTAGIWTDPPLFDDNANEDPSDDITLFADTGAEMGSGSALFAVPDPFSVDPARATPRGSGTVSNCRNGARPLWLVSLNVPDFAYAEIIARTATTITVKGNASNLGFDNGRYWLIAPPHVNPATGAMRGTNTGATFEPEYNTSYLWGLYRYQPPMTGFYVDPDGAPTAGVYGAQTGSNQAGWHHAGAREYDPSTGRWTTPDPAMSPWWNLIDYVRSDPLRLSDPTGLLSEAAEAIAYSYWGDHSAGLPYSAEDCDELQKAIRNAKMDRRNVQDAKEKAAYDEAIEYLRGLAQLRCAEFLDEEEAKDFERKMQGASAADAARLETCRPGRGSSSEVRVNTTGEVPDTLRPSKYTPVGDIVELDRVVRRHHWHDGDIRVFELVAHGPGGPGGTGISTPEGKFDSGKGVDDLDALGEILKGRTKKGDCTIILRVCDLGGHPKVRHALHRLANDTGCDVLVSMGACTARSDLDEFLIYRPSKK